MNLLKYVNFIKKKLQSDSMITTEGKVQITLKVTAKVEEVKMISVDSEEVDNINNKIEVVSIDEVHKTLVENEDMIGTEEAISIDNKDKMKIRTNVEEVSNLNIKSRAAKFVDKEESSDVVEIEKKNLRYPLKNILEPLAIKILISLVVFQILLIIVHS